MTIIVQSSSAAMGITIILAVNGWINFEIAAAIVLGENIGTTITAWLASIGTTLSARRAARAHLIFNVAGTCWMLILFYPFVSMVDSIMEGSIYLENVTSTELESHFDKYDDQSDPSPEEIATAKKSIVDTNIPLHLSLFHTMFNLCNIALLIGFSPRIAKLVERLVKDTGKSESI